MAFITEDFLLSGKTAKKLYPYAKAMPIIDYHCHLSPQEIYEDKHFDNITQIWLGGDHYKWRLMRSAGIDEKFITGDAPDEEKFKSWATVVGNAAGNPLLEWSHLELKNFFGYDGVLNEESWKEVWELANGKLKGLSARKLIQMSNVEVICTTDDPADDLAYHKLMAEDETMPCKVYPTFRPDKAVDIENPIWNAYINRLAGVFGAKIESFAQLKTALLKRLELFAENGCRVSDHGLSFVPARQISEEEAERIFAERRSGKEISEADAEGFKFALITFLAREYNRLGWAMQLHFGVKRDNSTRIAKLLGPDAGGDNIGSSAPLDKLANFLDALDKTDELPKTIIYSLNPTDNTAIDTIAASFQQGSCVSKIQHGSAWWFNDNFDGMTDQLTSLAAQGYLKGFVGMLTDSRSFLSYARHEYFRRILCRFVGGLVDDGRFPADEKTLKELIKDISYGNAKRYFGF